MADETQKKTEVTDQTESSAIKTSQKAAESGVIGGQPNQELHGQAFAKTHANDLRPSDPSLVATKDGETLEEYRARVASIKNNPFVIVDDEGPGNGSAADTGTVIDYVPQQTSKTSLVMGMDYEESLHVRTPTEKLQDFIAAATERATDAKGWKIWLQGEIDKAIGIGIGLNEAKEETKHAARIAWQALTDGTVVDFLSHPNAINDPMFHAIGSAFDAMAKDPNAVNHAMEKLGAEIIKASEEYSGLPDAEKGKVIGHFGFFLINPSGSSEGGELALKIADGVATQVDAAVMKAVEQTIAAARDATPQAAQEMKQMLYQYLRRQGLTAPEFEYAGVPKGYLDEITNADENVFFKKGDKGLPDGVKPSEKVELKHSLDEQGGFSYSLDVPEEVYLAGESQGFDRAAVKEKLNKAAEAVSKAYAEMGEYDAATHVSQRNYGTRFHELVRRYIGKDDILHTELSFKGGNEANWGQLGSSRIDIGLGKPKNPFASMCLKTLDAVPSAAQERGWARNLPLVDGKTPPRLYLKLAKP